MFLHGNVALPRDSSLPIEGIRKFCPKKIRQEKLTKFIKMFELYQVIMHNYLCQNVRIFLNYVLLIRKINTFWSGSIISVPIISMF